MDAAELKRLRAEWGGTQSQAASRAGIGIDYWRKLESGDRKISDSRARLITEAFSTPPEDDYETLVDQINRLGGEVRDLENRTAELALIVARHADVLAQLQAGPPPE